MNEQGEGEGDVETVCRFIPVGANCYCLQVDLTFKIEGRQGMHLWRISLTEMKVRSDVQRQKAMMEDLKAVLMLPIDLHHFLV